MIALIMSLKIYCNKSFFEEEEPLFILGNIES